MTTIRGPAQLVLLTCARPGHRPGRRTGHAPDEPTRACMASARRRRVTSATFLGRSMTFTSATISTTRETSGDPDPTGNTRGQPADREEPDGVLLPFPLRRPPRLAEPHPPDRDTRGALAAAILTLPAGAD